ncbi:DinB family protein [Staphylococcus pseudintermedius]
MDVRYPIGRLEVPATVTRRHIDSWLEEIAQYIQNLRKTVANLSQDEWVKLADSDLPIEVSIQMLDAINQRVVAIGQHLTEKELARDFVLEGSGATTVGETVAKLSWHARHHLAHIQIALGELEVNDAL